MKALAIRVDHDLCSTCDVCTSLAPNTFELDDEGKAVVKDPEGDPRDIIIDAAEGCPVEAIFMRDGETGEQLVPREQ